MRKSLSLLVMGVVFLMSAPAFAASAKPTRCPTFIGNPKTKTFFRVPARFVCSAKTLKNSTLTESDVLTKSSYELLNEFDMDGQGDANSPAFQVSRKPAFITFSVNDPSEKALFRLSVIDVSTRKVVEVLTMTKGSVASGSTFSHAKGAFYLRVDAESTVRVCERVTTTVCNEQPVVWHIHLE